MKIKNYINLTNGIEYLSSLERVDGFVRIQSSVCESKSWWKLIFDLDYAFLLDIAKGNQINLYDASQNKKFSRALYQGIEWIRFILYKRWHNLDYVPKIKESFCQEYFLEVYNEFGKERRQALKKIDYVKRIVTPNLRIIINPVCQKTKNDGNYSYFKKIMNETFKN